MRARDRDGGFGRHARVAYGVCAEKTGKIEPAGDGIGVTDTLEHFDGVALAQDGGGRYIVDQPAARRLAIALRLEDRVVLDLVRLDGGAERLGKPSSGGWAIDAA